MGARSTFSPAIVSVMDFEMYRETWYTPFAVRRMRSFLRGLNWCAMVVVLDRGRQELHDMCPDLLLTLTYSENPASHYDKWPLAILGRAPSDSLSRLSLPPASCVALHKRDDVEVYSVLDA
jgi:hypothetical protein